MTARTRLKSLHMRAPLCRQMGQTVVPVSASNVLQECKCTAGTQRRASQLVAAGTSMHAQAAAPNHGNLEVVLGLQATFEHAHLSAWVEWMELELCIQSPKPAVATSAFAASA